MYLVPSVREPDRLGNTVSNKTVKTVKIQLKKTTDGRTMTYSEHELEFTFAKNVFKYID